MAKIRTLKDGPLLVEGDEVEIADADGKGYPVLKRPFALCRCGSSANKPFCDGTHRTIGFHSDESAPITSVRD